MPLFGDFVNVLVCLGYGVVVLVPKRIFGRVCMNKFMFVLNCYVYLS